MKQKLQEYALVAEIISAAAIVLSLIFVGLQVSQGNKETAANTEALRSQVRESMLSADLAMLNKALDFPELIDYNFRMEGKSEEDIRRMVVWMYQFNRTRENYWVQHQNGILDTDTYLSYRAPYVRMIINNEVASQSWMAEARHTLTPGFVAEINDLLIAEGRFTAEELAP
jgi:hypothetical protein